MTVHPHEPVRTRRSALASRLGMVCLAGIAAALAIVGASAAFGGNGGTSRAAAATAALTAENFPGGRNIQGDKILMSLASTPSNSFYIPQVAGAKAAAKITGLNVQFQYGKDDDPTQVSQVNTALASGIKGLAAEAETRALNKTLCAARAKGIPVVTQGANATTGKARSCVQAFVGQDFVASGRLIAQRMVDAGYVKRATKAFCPVELPTQVYAVQRYQGVMEVLKPLGASCELLGTGIDLGPAKAKMVDYLLGHRKTQAMIALGQTPATVAPQAVKAAGLKMPIGGFDLSQPILQAIKNGQMLATVDQQPYAQGFYAVMAVAMYLKYGLAPMDMNTSGHAVVDSSNVNQVIALSPAYR